jgi:hypothetical protein
LQGINPMLLAVVLDGDHAIFPAHVEVIRPIVGYHGNLGLRSRQAGIDENQPQESFPR